MTRHLFLAVVLLLAGIGAASAHSYKLGTLEIGHPWARATPPTAPTGGGYLSVKNTGTEPDKLLSASSPAAGAVQVPDMKLEGNVMRMRELETPLEI
jgi:copper(I)-binding protein